MQVILVSSLRDGVTKAKNAENFIDIEIRAKFLGIIKTKPHVQPPCSTLGKGFLGCINNISNNLSAFGHIYFVKNLPFKFEQFLVALFVKI